MEIPVLKLGKTSSSVSVILIIFLAVLLVNSTALGFELTSSVHSLGSGPIVIVQCTATFPAGTMGYTIIWKRSDKILFVNEVRRTAPSRYTVSYSAMLLTCRSTINIHNAVKQDEDAYECLAQFSNSTMYAMGIVEVTIAQYLPAENYPECSLQSSDGINTHNSISFSCLTGYSNPRVKLQLTRDQTDGLNVPIGQASYSGDASATVALPDSKVTFICTMTSSIFTTAYRLCSATFSPDEMPSTNTTITISPMETPQSAYSVGPITLLPEEKSSTNLMESSEFVPTEHPKYETTLSPETQTTKLRATSNAKSLLFPSIIGGSAAGLLVVIILVIIMCIMIRNKSCITKNSNPANRPSNTHLLGSMNSPHTATNVNGYKPPSPLPLAKQESRTYDYADVLNLGTAPPSKPNTSDKINKADGQKSCPKIGQTSVQDSRTSEDGYEFPPQGSGIYDYAYADVNKVGTSAIKKKSSTASYDYPDALTAKPGKGSNFPVYSQVNKSFKSDLSQNKDDDEQDSIMVDNIVYVSAEPK